MMMNTKTIVIALTLAGTSFQLGASPFNKEVYLQTETINDSKPKKQSIMDQLGLSKEQKKSVSLINKKYDKQIEKVKTDETLEKEVRKAEVKKILDLKHAEYKKILTPEQYQKFEQLYAEKKEAKKEKENKEKRAELIETLNLSNDQIIKVDAIKEKYKPELKAIKEDTSKTEAEKEVLIEALKQKQKTEIKLIFTPEQLKKLEVKENKK
jgi:Spy/CpxP family protein refolding chaperone